MIDIHSHILPGVDDGASTIEDSLDMARSAHLRGIQKIIATPHYGNGRFQVSRDQVDYQMNELEERLRDEQIPIEVFPGHEVRITRDLIEDVLSGKVLTLANSNYLLVEFPHNEVPKFTDEIVHELTLLGIVPIIAHPERNIEIANNPDVLADLVELGALTQITSHTLIGQFGKKGVSICNELCNRNLVHFIASDAHDIEVRGFSLTEGYRVLVQKFGPDYVEYLKLNAVRLLSNEHIEAYRKVETTSLWTKWFRK
jgi:protein-tyrosine phosphatase